MGNSCGGGAGKASALTTHTIYVKTGDKKGAETDGNIFVCMADEEGKWSDESLLDTKWKDDFERGNTDVFHMESPGLGKIKEISIRRDETCATDAWYLEKLVIDHRSTKAQSVFPVTRWINANDKLVLTEFDCSLPADDKNAKQRALELEKKRENYQLVENVPGAPKQVAALPDDERFTNEYQWDIQSMKLKLFAQTAYINLTTSKFKKLDDFNDVYKGKLFPVPYGQENWRSDEEFGNQRLSGCNPTMLELCTKIPENFAVTSEMIYPFLEGKSVEDAMQKKKLYILDLTYMAAIKCVEDRPLCGPLGLFYSNDRGDLVPIAIQLMPEPADDNPVFLPSDPEYTWIAAKMWFNLSDCSHHQSVTHLGFTHLVVESIAICTHRQLSVSHPIFKLLAPHFIYLLAINTLAVNKLVSPGGWVDETMQIGRDGMFGIIAKNWGDWDMKTHGNIVNDFKRRGVDDTEALPHYHYRDDALLMWSAIQKYVCAVVDGFYDTPEKLAADTEIQGWVKEIAESGVKGVPSSASSNEELSEVITTFIFMASVGHAAANFCQYDEYAYPPNYPAKLMGDRPKNKEPLDEEAILSSLADKKQTLSVMIVTKLLSQRGTNELTNFEVQYAHDPITMAALQQFKADLKEVSATIDARNAKRKRKYPYLHPREVPNAISI